MNELPEHLSDESTDPLLDDLLSPLKSLRPPLEAQLANRSAVAGELSRLAVKAKTRSLPWWRQSVSVPLPVAAGVAALMLASFILPLRWAGAPHQSADQEISPINTNATKSIPDSPPLAVANRHAASPPAMEYYETEVYLCGIGRLSSESGYVIREQ